MISVPLRGETSWLVPKYIHALGCLCDNPVFAQVCVDSMCITAHVVNSACDTHHTMCCVCISRFVDKGAFSCILAILFVQFGLLGTL